MGFKEWPYWLKGGMIGLFIGLIGFVFGGWFGIAFILALGCNPKDTALFAAPFCQMNIPLAVILVGMILLFLGFVFWSILGFIYGKIKNKY